MKIIVTGAAGFIGSKVSHLLLERGDEVIGVDNLNDYYDVTLKKSRLELLKAYSQFFFYETDVADQNSITHLFATEKAQRVIHLAAQAGVRYSIQNPHIYVQANVVGFLNILEACRHYGIEHLVYASTSSVYGANTQLPFSAQDSVDHPLSLYAATKKSNELMAHCYSHLYSIPTTGLRFFTVYGPWGRPDMALFLFTKNILADKPIDVFNHGHHRRDFTYIDDIADGVVRVLARPATASEPKSNQLSYPDKSPCAPYRVYNIGNNRPINLSHYIDVLEHHLGRKAKKRLLPMQPGDVPETFADVNSLIEDFGYKPNTSIEFGVEQFVKWYRNYYYN